jgi:hypothetical protein
MNQASRDHKGGEIGPGSLGDTVRPERFSHWAVCACWFGCLLPETGSHAAHRSGLDGDKR